MREDVLHEIHTVTATRSVAGTSVSIGANLSGDVALPCVAQVYRAGALITGLTVTACTNQVLTVSATAPAGYTDAQVNPADTLQFPETVVLAQNGTAQGLQVLTSYSPEVTLTDGATITADCSKNQNFKVTITATGRTLTPANMVPGQKARVRVIQGTGGSKTITTYTNVVWSGGSAPTLQTSAAAFDVLEFECIGSGAGSILGTVKGGGYA